MNNKLAKIIKNPWVDLIVGIALMLTSGWEVYESFETAELGAHHGMLLFSIAQILKVIPDVVEGVRAVNEGIDEVKERGDLEDLNGEDEDVEA